MEGKILIVDDETGIRNSLSDYLTRQGFVIVQAEDGVQALEKIREEDPDIVVLDFQLPLIDGLEICKKIRQETNQLTGIIMISGIRKESADRIVGLEVGADVYMTKPFAASELVAQIRALLRRMQAEKQVASTGWLIADDYLRINFKGRTVKAGGKEVHLTKLEFDLLKYLAERHGEPIARADLIDNVWGYEAGGDISDGAVNVAVTKLRSKIEPDPGNPRYIHSMHGIGYYFKLKRDRRE
jgi:DNA-binding response OmpR family regulator